MHFRKKIQYIEIYVKTEGLVVELDQEENSRPSASACQETTARLVW